MEAAPLDDPSAILKEDLEAATEPTAGVEAGLVVLTPTLPVAAEALYGTF